MGKKMVNRGRHEAACKICQHPKREEIDRAWVDWGNTTRLSKEYGVSRDGLYRHAHAWGLFEKRGGNVKKALEHLIERAEEVEVNAAAVVAAVQAYAKISAAGIWTDRIEQVSADLFQRMTAEELESYASDGELPDWFAAATPNPDKEAGKDEQSH